MRVKNTLFRIGSAVLIAGVSVAGIIGTSAKTEAACAVNAANLGQATGSFTIPTAGTYRVWSRMQPDSADVTHNSYTLEIDGGTVMAGSATCGITVGDSSIPANTWTWVDYRDGNSANKLNVTLSAGTHTYTLYGRELSVKVDRVVFSADPTCTPTSNGDNCANTTLPTTPAPKRGDVNKDGKVDTSDLFILLANFGKTVPVNTKGDCNGDSKVDTSDLFILLAAFGK